MSSNPDAQPRPALIADWRDLVFLHFAVHPADLAPHTPYPLDLYNGRAWVSLVSFQLENLRPAFGVPPWLGRMCLRPASDHLFLNVRTYVRGPAGPGIHFIAEWIDNPISARLGPLTYGLPYRLADMTRQDLGGAGLRRIAVKDRSTGRAAQLVVPAPGNDESPRPTRAGSLDAFLLERYRAYTHRRGIGRSFTVAHAAWQAQPFQLARCDLGLFEAEYSWWQRATFVRGHRAEGFRDIAMGAPRKLAVSSVVAASSRLPAGAAGG